METAVLQWIGVKHLPTFDGPRVPGMAAPRKRLGEACGGVNIARCQKFFNVNTEGLETVACAICDVEHT